MKLIFTLTAGRTGTAYLSELIQWNVPDAAAHHEIQTYASFGEDTPDISHLHAFNNIGNTQAVQEFWQRKFAKIIACGKPVYVETSHLLMKAGLVENIVELARGHEVHFILLKRDAMKNIESFHNHGDFMGLGNLWMRYLDPAYACNRVSLAPVYSFSSQAHSLMIWYLAEVEARSVQYRFHYGDCPHVRFHSVDIDELNDTRNVADLFDRLGLKYADIVIPPPQNASILRIPIEKSKKAWLEKAIKECSLYRGAGA